jgi:type I restriction enzyme R subunit
MAQEFLNARGAIDIHGADLPHWQQDEALQFVTFRLGDSLPQSKLRTWKMERSLWLAEHPEPWDEETRQAYHRIFSLRLERWLDAGHGSCLFAEPSHRKVLADTLKRDDPSRAVFFCWIIMPNHVHLLFQPKFPLPDLMKAWKGISARRIGQGSIWQRNYRDTLIRNVDHLERVVRYIRNNRKSINPDQYALWESERTKAIL